MTKHLRPSVIALAIAMSFTFTVVTPAGATGLIAGATEPTALANLAENTAQLATQAVQLEQEIMTQVNTYKTMIAELQNLKNLPADMMNKMLEPYQKQIAAFKEIQTSVKDIKNAADNTRAMFSSRGMDFSASGKSLSEYLKFEIALADKKGGAYKKRMDQDIAAMDSMAEKATALKTASAKTANITGNVQGLQHLSQLASMQAGELMEIKSALLNQSIDRNQDKMEAQNGKKVTAQYRQNMVDSIGKQKAEADKIQFTFPDVNKSWPGVNTQ